MNYKDLDLLATLENLNLTLTCDANVVDIIDNGDWVQVLFEAGDNPSISVSADKDQLVFKAPETLFSHDITIVVLEDVSDGTLKYTWLHGRDWSIKGAQAHFDKPVVQLLLQ